MNSDDVYIETIKQQIASGMYDHLFQKEIRPGVYEKRAGLTFLDIGANIGLVSIYAVPYCKRIVAVEPSPETFDKLQKNTKDYVIISCDQRALAPEDKIVEFYVNDLNFTASSTVNTYGEKTTVMGSTLSSLLDRNYLTHVDVCKIDCEGGEGESLSLLQLDLAREIIDQYFIEFHNCPKTSWEHKLGTTVSNLLRCGYHKIDVKGMALTASK
jgi:FkbM family methyltransferase